MGQIKTLRSEGYTVGYNTAVVCVICVGVPVSVQYGVTMITAAEASAVNEMSSVVELCPYAAHGHCPYNDNCGYVHGDVCDLCQCAVLSPFDLDQRQQHTEVSIESVTSVIDVTYTIYVLW